MNKARPAKNMAPPRGRTTAGAAALGHCCLLALLMQQQLAGASAAEGSTAGARPNVVIMFADNLGYGDIGALGVPAAAAETATAEAQCHC